MTTALLRPLPALALLVAGVAFLLHAATPRMAALWLVGAGLGVALFHAAFGFAGAFRRLLRERRGAGFRAILLLTAVLAAVFPPLIAADPSLRGFVFPTGWALLLGAFLFGVGMQLGGGCGSGTLYVAGGGGAPRMWLTLAAFVAGATLAAWQSPLWEGWAALPPLSLPEALGAGPAVALALALLGAAWWASVAWERARHGGAEALRWRGGHWLRGPWPVLWGVAALALLSVLALLVGGRPWAITAAFPLWGSKLVEAAGWDDPSFWPFWEDPTRVEAYLRPLWLDRITVMDVGLMAGAALAAGLGARRSWRWPRAGEWAASLAGGLLLGVGAVLASGCNISAFLAGVASGSLHGWVWIVPALAGNAVGLSLRPAFGFRETN